MRPLTAPEIVRELDLSIVGHERAKRTLAIGIRNRWRIQQAHKCSNSGVAANRFLISGSPGSGKSFLIWHAASAVNAPFTRITALQLVGSGAPENAAGAMLDALVESVRPGCPTVEQAIEEVRASAIVLIEGLDRLFPAGLPDDSYDTQLIALQHAFLGLMSEASFHTRHGAVCTADMLIVAETQLSSTRLADLWPDLQQTFPRRMELETLTDDDLVQILALNTSPVQHYIALMASEGLTLQFTPEALEAIAFHAAEQNRKTDDNGARRLPVVIEAVLDDLLFDPASAAQDNVTIDAGYVTSHLAVDGEDDDLTDFIL